MVLEAELLVHAEVVEDGHAGRQVDLLLLATDLDRLGIEDTPRGQALGVLFTEQASDAIDEVREVESLDVPSGQDVGHEVLGLPEVEELLEEGVLVLTLVVLDVLEVWLVVLEAESYDAVTTLESDGRHGLVCGLNVGEAGAGVGLDVDGDYGDKRRVVFYLTLEDLVDARVLVVRRAKDSDALDSCILLDELLTFPHALELILSHGRAV